ncbi:class I adenylate-forming enzyme family protein [bacterium]
MTIGGILEEQAKKNPDKVFMYFDDITKTYAEMDEIANRMGNALKELGVEHGDNVCLLLTNVPQFIYTFFGLAKIGAVTCPINPALRPDELQYIIDNCDAKVLVVEEMLIPHVRQIRDKLPKLNKVVLVGENPEGDELNFNGILESAPPSPPGAEVKDSDLAAIIYTSGTTGKPKGAMLSHGNYIWDAKVMGEQATMNEDDRFMCILPLFHVNGQVVTVLGPLVVGASMVLVQRFSASNFFTTVDKYKPTAFSAVPTIYAMLLNTPGTEEFDLSSLRFCICGAAPMPVEVFNKFEEKFKAIILEGYGLSEGTCASSVNPLDGTRKVGSIGIPFTGQEMRIAGADGNELPVGERGEIAIKGPNVMQGYYNNPKATADALKDGWLYTGDMGYVDEDGYFFISGRLKEMIIRGGENIYPKEIEEFLYQHDAVAEAAVVGIPDEFYGEEVKAFIVLKEDKSVGEEEMLEFCKQKMAKYKSPKSIQFIKEMPKTPTGKIQKKKLVEDPTWTSG